MKNLADIEAYPQAELKQILSMEQEQNDVISFIKDEDMSAREIFLLIDS